MADATKLNQLKAELKSLQDQIASLNHDTVEKRAAIAAKQGEIRTEEARLAEIVSTADVYDTSGPQMQKELDADKTAIAKKRPIAELEVKDRQEKLDERAKKFAEDLEKDGKAATNAANKAKQAATNADAAVKDLQDKQAAFASVKEQPKATAARLNELKRLLGEIAKAEVQDDSVAMYFYVLEAEALTDGIKVPKPADYRTQVVDALAAIEASKNTAAAKKADLDKANADAAEARKKHQAALASRRADLLKALREVQPGP